MQSIYNIKVHDIHKKEFSLAPLKGKVLLIVNVASACGFTPQYKELEELYQEFKEDGFEILAFPCNQFLHQESGTNEEIEKFCETNFHITFKLFDKIEVNGKNAHPLYQFLKAKKDGLFSSAIKWNFTKFLVDSEGEVIKRYAPYTSPSTIKKDLKLLL